MLFPPQRKLQKALLKIANELTVAKRNLKKFDISIPDTDKKIISQLSQSSKPPG